MEMETSHFLKIYARNESAEPFLSLAKGGITTHNTYSILKGKGVSMKVKKGCSCIRSFGTLKSTSSQKISFCYVLCPLKCLTLNLLTTICVKFVTREVFSHSSTEVCALP